MKFLVSAFAFALVATGWGQTPEAKEVTTGRAEFWSPGDRASKFQNARTVFPTRLVRASQDVSPINEHPGSIGFRPRYVWSGATNGLEEFIARTHTSALLMLQNGQMIYETYRKGASTNTPFISFSLAKSVTSLLVGIAVEEGHIESINDPITRYVPGLIGTPYDGASIKDALQMVCGVPFERDYYGTALTNSMSRAIHESFLHQRYRFVEAANSLKRESPTGFKFHYSTLETAVLGWVVENATRRRLSQYMEEKLWRPGGMESDAAWLLDGPADIGREMAGYGLTATARDYARFGRLVAGGGTYAGRRVVGTEWIRASVTPDRAPVRCGALYEGYPLGYGYQWWIYPNGRFEGQGIYGQFIYIAPQEQVIIVKLSHWPEPWVDSLEKESIAFFESVVDALH